jgi:hypothetical protein
MENRSGIDAGDLPAETWCGHLEMNAFGHDQLRSPRKLSASVTET